MTDRLCSVVGCGRTVKAYGYCQGHWKRVAKRGSAGGLLRAKVKNGEACSVAGCASRCVGSGMCNRHYQRIRATGDPLNCRPPVWLSCMACDHDDVADIDAAIRARMSDQRVADAFGLGRTTILRHRRNHMENPAWHTKRAAWWASELRTMTASQHQEQTA